MATYTPNFQLHQWAPEDHFLRSDFNQDFSRIDTAIKVVKTAGSEEVALARSDLNATVSAVRTDLTAAKTTLEEVKAKKSEVYLGTYSGNGAYTRTISLGFQPKAVLLEESSGTRASNGTYGGLAFYGSSLYTPTGHEAMRVTASGFTLFDVDGSMVNRQGRTYFYVVFR